MPDFPLEISSAEEHSRVPPIPEPHPNPFRQAIAHPSLYLWDSWCFSDEGSWHLYTLALAKRDRAGLPIAQENRNNYQFHIRHFTSKDRGDTWWDQGAFQKPEKTENGYFDRNVWSGCSTLLSSGTILFGFTGIREISEDRPFLQSIGLAISSSDHSLGTVVSDPLSCPLRDYETILEKGYYLGAKDRLGCRIGEEDGPILAWRDPFIFTDPDGDIHAVWSAKTAPRVGVMAHALLEEVEGGYKIATLLPPVTYPDSHLFTQAEVPKVYYDPRGKTYYCILAACDSLYEGQPDSEVTKVTRLYKSDAIRGPWEPYRPEGSLVPGLENYFGVSVIEANFDRNELVLLPPITEKADDSAMLSIAPPTLIQI